MQPLHVFMFIPWTPGMNLRRGSLDCEVGWRISLETNSSGIVRGFAQWGLLWRDFFVKLNVLPVFSNKKYSTVCEKCWYKVWSDFYPFSMFFFIWHMCFNFLVWKTQHSKGVEKHHSWSLEPHPTILWISVYSKNPRKIRFSKENFWYPWDGTLAAV